MVNCIKGSRGVGAVHRTGSRRSLEHAPLVGLSHGAKPCLQAHTCKITKSGKPSPCVSWRIQVHLHCRLIHRGFRKALRRSAPYSDRANLHVRLLKGSKASRGQ